MESMAGDDGGVCARVAGVGSSRHPLCECSCKKVLVGVEEGRRRACLSITAALCFATSLWSLSVRGCARAEAQLRVKSRDDVMNRSPSLVSRSHSLTASTESSVHEKMTTKAPASAALLAQAVGDVAPFLGTGSSSGLATPTQELQPGPTTQLDMGAPTWTETLCGPLGSRRRFVSFHLVALALSTAIRSCLFSTELGFGKYLLENLAPVEREGVRWFWIVGMRALELAAGALVWKRVRGAVKHDGGERARWRQLLMICFAG